MNQYFKISIFSILLLSITIFSKAHVSLEYPKGGETIVANGIITIEWAIVVYHGPCDWDLLYSSDGGATWDTIAKNLPEAQLTLEWTVDESLTSEARIRVYQDNVNAGNYFDESGNFTISLTAGLFDTPLSADIITLNTPYPNPGSKFIKFSFTLSRSSFVTIIVFDQMGRKLETLMDKKLFEGDHEVTWYSQNLKPGNYFCRFSAGGYTQTKRVIRSNIP